VLHHAKTYNKTNEDKKTRKNETRELTNALTKQHRAAHGHPL